MEIDFINAIGSLGFPIVACCYLAYMHNESEKQRISDEQRHSDERNRMTEALTKMNTTLDYILSYIKSKDDENA